VNKRLMRFNSHHLFYRSTSGEVFRFIRTGLNKPPYNVYEIYDGKGEKLKAVGYTLSMAMELCESISGGEGAQNEG